MKRYHLYGLERSCFVYFEIRRCMYGLQQAGRLSQNRLIEHLAHHGYILCPNTPCLLWHRTREIIFSLVVDDLLRCTVRSPILHQSPRKSIAPERLQNHHPLRRRPVPRDAHCIQHRTHRRHHLHAELRAENAHPFSASNLRQGSYVARPARLLVARPARLVATLLPSTAENHRNLYLSTIPRAFLQNPSPNSRPS